MLRVLEEPLGEDAREVPTREEVAKLWAHARHAPIPDYDEFTLGRFLFERYRR